MRIFINETDLYTAFKAWMDSVTGPDGNYKWWTEMSDDGRDISIWLTNKSERQHTGVWYQRKTKNTGRIVKKVWADGLTWSKEVSKHFTLGDDVLNKLMTIYIEQVFHLSFHI